MFTRFVCSLLVFRARKFPVKSEKPLDIYRWPKVVLYGDNYSSIHYVLATLPILFGAHLVMDQWIKSDTMC